jgi:GntR family transcriptional regulator
MKMLDRQSPIPLAYQLTTILRDMISSGEYPPHSLFPTEEQLTIKYDISRTTVRIALSNLVNEGLIYREQGRGTFVNVKRSNENQRNGLFGRGRVARDVVQIKSTTNIIRSAGMTPSTKLLRFIVEQPDETIVENLKIRPEHVVWYIERLRFADDIPVLLERVWVPQFMLPNITKEELEGSLFQVYTEKCGYKLSWAHQILRAVSLSAEDAEILGQEKGSPAMYVTGVTYLDDGRPIEMENSLFNSQITEFNVDLGESSEFARIRKTEVIDGQLARS